MAADDALDSALIQFKQEQDDQKTLGVTSSMHQAITQNPDEMARYNAISRKTGFDPLLIATDPQVKVEAERRARLQDIDLPGMVQTHPKTASALTDANLAALVHDDVGSLTALEDVFGFIAKSGKAVASAVPQAAAGLWGITQAASDIFLRPYTREISRFTGAPDVGAAISEQSKESRQRLGVTTKALMPKAEGVIEAGYYAGLQSLGISALTFPVAFAGAPGAALGTMAGTVGGEAYGEAADKGLSPVKALLFGASQAAVEFATEKIPMGKLLKDLEVGTPLYKTLAHQMAREVPGEQVATLVQDLNEWAVLHPDKPFSDYAAQRPSAFVQTLIATVVGTGGTVATAKGLELLTRDRGEAQRLQRSADAYDALSSLSQAAATAKLRERDPARFKQFMQSMAEDSDLKEVFIDGSTLQNALAQAPVEVQQKFAQDMPEVMAQLGEATATDGAVRVPVEDYATHIAGTDLDAMILPNLRAEASGLSYSEVQEQVKTQTEQMQAEADKELAAQEQDKEYQADAQKVYDTLLTRVEGAKRFSPDANKKYAALQQAYFITRAKKLGMKPSELLGRFDVKVQAEKTGAATELEQGQVTPLEGLPQPKMMLKTGEYTPKPYAPAHRAAQAYAAASGMSYQPPRKYVKVDEDRARRIAAEYDKMPHAPNDPEVARAYAQMIKEAVQQYDAMLATGLKVEFIPEGAPDPYAENPHGFIDDIVRNNHMWVFSTRAGFGTAQDFTPQDHPLLAETDIEISGQKALANDIFRAVHDFFGHAKDGVGFRASGEENAWRAHAAMFSPIARRALTTETRGQNSWLNYGPYGEANRTAKAGETHFADQKAGLLPEWVSEEGREDAIVAPPPASSDYGYRAREKARVATLEDFTAVGVTNLLRKKDWAILTAENPNAQQLSAEENAQRNADLRADLEALGVQFVEVKGKYGGNVENSFAITGITKDQATELGQKYGQQAVLTRDGFVGQDGTVNPAKGVKIHAKAPSDFYSRIPSTGAVFAVDIDFGKTVPASDLRVGEVQVDAVHFSRAPRTSLSGRMYGTGIKGAEARRLADPNAHPKIKDRVSFYVDEGHGVRPEAGVGAFRHELTLTNIYDGAKNPLGFPSEPNAFEAAVINAGFDGYYIREGFGNQGVGVLLGDAAQNVEVDIPPASAVFEQRYQTETPEFKKWFGDSKVVDAKGNPLVVYHGTAISSVSVFRGNRGAAGHFAFNPEFANDFAQSAHEREMEILASGEDDLGDGGVVYPVYIKAERIFDARNSAHIAEAGLELAGVTDYAGLEDNLFAIKAAGFDSYYDFENKLSVEPTGIAVFDPTQIKSATGNIGTFDPKNANILYQSLNEVAETLPPTGKLEQQDLADLRKLWAMYAASDTAAQYGTAQVKAFANDAPGYQKALTDTLDAVLRGDDVSVKNITKWHEGTQRLPAGGLAYEIVSGNSSAAVYLDMSDRSIQIDITRWGEGRGGSGVYKAVLDFARANGFVFHGDAQGISVAGIKRRLENLLSHALQSGDTSYMRLHPKQIEFIEQETGLKVEWTNDSKNNVEQMLNASYNLANLDIKELQNVYFDFIQKQFVARDTGAPADIAGLVAKARRNADAVRREGAPGLASAKRTIFANTLLSATGENRRHVFAEMARFSLEQLPGAERLLYQSEAGGERPAFYSALSRTVAESKQAKGTPDQWIGIIKNFTQKGVKADELEYTGVLDWLETRKDKADSWHTVDTEGNVISASDRKLTPPEGYTVRLYQPSKVVTKEEITDFLKANAVTVEPRVYGGEGTISEFDFSFDQWETEEPDEDYLRERAEERLDEIVQEDDANRLADEHGNVEDDEAYAVLLQALIDEPRNTTQKKEFWDARPEEKRVRDEIVESLFEVERENYWNDSDSPQSREVTVEAGGRTFTFTHTYSYGEQALYDAEKGKQIELSFRADEAEVESAIRDHLSNEYGISEVDEDEAPKFESYKLSGGENYRERLLLNKSHKGETFSYTNHFDDDNIIAHTRVDDREVPAESIEKDFPELAARLKAEGRKTAKVYFIEEVQSDWAQQGRERPEVSVPYTAEELTVNEARSNGDTELLKVLKVVEIHDARGAEFDGRSNIWHIEKTDAPQDQKPLLVGNRGGYNTKADAEYARFQVADANQWVINAPGQVIKLNKDSYPTAAEAIQYILDNRTHTVPSKLNAFEIGKKHAALDKQIMALSQQLSDEQAANGLSDRFRELSAQRADLTDEQTRLSAAVPPGAFVESTDAWVSLVMKDAIHQAAVGGYDLVSWTTGDQQTQRWSYGLRKQVDEIKWEKSADGKIHIIAMKGNNKAADTHYGENDLSAAIGKTMAKRIIEDPNQEGWIKGVDIVVADLGMTKFYGDAHGLNPDGKPAIVGKVANQVLKKLGGGQVKGSDLRAPVDAKGIRRVSAAEAADSMLALQPTFEVTPQMREIALQGQVLFQPVVRIDEAQVQKLQEKLDTDRLDAESFYKRGYRIDEVGNMERTGQDLSASDMFQKNRGTFNPDTLTISLLKDADLTTFLHETGHFFLETEAALATDPRATPEMRAEFTKALNWMGVQDIAEWNALSFEQKRPHHEKFARGFEAYLFEGRAPSNELRSVFASFKSWLLHVYRSITNLNVELTDEVRGVFDRMLASEEEIAAVQQRAGMTAAMLESASQKDKAAYAALDVGAGGDAGDELQRRSLRDMKWLSNAKSAELKKLQREASSKRKEVRAEVTAEVNAEPINQARAFLRRGTTIDPATGDQVQATEGFRLNRQIVAEMYPETMLARPDTGKLRGMTEADGLHPDLVADMFGFRSGDALIRELIDGENPRDKIAGLTDQRMLERYGDLVDERAIEQAANEAVHNDARARFMATGLKMLSNSKLPASQIQKAAADAAAQTVAAKKVRDLHPSRYIVAETKANREVLKQVAKDPKAAQRAQRSALLNNRLAKAAQDALEEVRKGVDKMNRTQKAAAQANMRGEYLIQLNELLARFDLRKSTTLKEIDAKRTPLAEWLATESERLSAVMPDIPGWILNEANRRSYKDLTVEEFRGLTDAVKQLEMMARREQEQYQAIRGMKFREERKEILDRIREFHPEAFSLDGEPLGMSPKFVKHLGDKVEEIGEKFVGEFLNAETLVNLLEGGNFGIVHESLIGRMSKQADWKATRLGDIYNKMAPLFGQYSVKERYAFARADIGAPIGMSLTRENALVVALLHGNTEGRERLANYGWSEKQQEAIIGLLDERDMRVAEGIWDLFDNDLWPELKALNDRTRGKSPPKVVAIQVFHKGKAYRGGYFRLKYDTNLDERAYRLDEGAAVKELLGGGLGMSAKTGQGASTERKQNVTMRPRLDLGVFAEAVSETVHDLAYREAVADTMRMLNDVRIQNTIKTAAGVPTYRALITRVREIAAPPRNPSGFIEKTLSTARKNTVITLMSGVSTALQNFTGFVSATARVNPGRLAREIALFYSPQMTQRYNFALSQSEYMRNRHNAFERDLQNEIKKMTVNANIMPDTGAWLTLMSLVDKGTSVPVWNAAFAEGMVKFENENGKAVDYADHVVRQTQGSGRELDVAQIMSGHGGYGQLKRVFTMFYSYFNAQLGMLVRSGLISAKQAKANPGTAVAHFTKDFMVIVVLPAVLTAMVFKKDDPDEDPEKWLSKYGHAIAMYGMAMIPLVRDIGSFAWASFDHDVKNYGYKITPIQSAGEGMVRGGVAARDIAIGEGDDKDLKNLIMGTSYAVGLPGKLISDTTLGTKAFLEGEAGPEAVVLGPPRK